MGNTPIEIEITGWTISTEELFPLASTIELAAVGCVETLKLGSRRLPLELGSEATVETCYIEGGIYNGRFYACVLLISSST